MKLAREGVPFLLATVLPFVATASVAYLGDSRLWTVVALALGVLSLFVAFFFRDPERRSDSESDVALSAADGRVVDIAQASEPFMGGSCRRISTFLSIFDVHVQRAPFRGRVEERTYDAGKFLAAWEPKASTENERAALGIATSRGRVLVRQIAGLVARRIVTYPEMGDDLKRGERIGLIRFGSRVDLFVPLDWDVLCSVGDRVRAGKSEMARPPDAASTEDQSSPPSQEAS